MSIVLSHGVFANQLSDNIFIKSESLGYDLHIRVYLPEDIDALSSVKTLYVVDGQAFIANGHLDEVVKNQVEAKQISPIITVFVDSRDPHNPALNRRNEQFMCNAKYATFFVSELMPYIQQHYPSSSERDDNVIMGLSFGGLNAACFGLMVSDYFGGLGMLSPANSEMLREMRKAYRKAKPRHFTVFLSFGTKNDNILEGRRFKSTLDHLKYDIHYIETNEGHNWQNWNPLLDDLLKVFFSQHVKTSITTRQKDR